MTESVLTPQLTKKVPVVKSFFRYNVSAGTATVCDFLVLIFATEILGFYYVLSGFFGALTGASVAFFLGRNWTFFNKIGAVSKQGLRFLMVFVGSIALNTLGLYIFTDILQVGHYSISKMMVAVLVGACFNFPMQRYFVFR